MDVKDFRCCVCEQTGQWENVDRFRLKPQDTHLCLSCGFVSYPTRYQTEEDLKDYYRKQYRSIPQVGNLYSGERKLHYHHFFLKPLFDEWKKLGIDRPVVGEIGSALGMFLHWLKGQVPGAQVHGTELTEGYRKVSYYEYGIFLTEDFDFSKKYDLIASYHVLEHQCDADIKLEKYAECLKDTGVFYLSCPIWFRDLNNSATGGFDIEYYWHPDHINAWSETHLEWVIARAGLEIVMKNNDVYGNTYILKKGIKKFDAPKWDVAKNKDFMERAYKVWGHIQENRADIAISLHPNCPSAWINHYEFNRNSFHKDRKALDEFLKQAEEACPNSGDINVFIADVLSRYERYSEALDMFYKALNRKPNAPTIIMGISNCYRQLALKEKDKDKRTAWIKKSLDANAFVESSSLELRDKATSWKFHDFCLLELPGGNNEKTNLSSVATNV